MAHCDEYVELISAAIDGAISCAQREELEAHLASCPECRALYEEMDALHTALGGLPAAEVPADLTGRIMAAVAAEQVLPFAPAETKKAPIRWRRWLASAAVLAVVLMGTWGWKPWENTARDLAPPGTESAAQQNAMADHWEPLPEASEAVEAAPESVLTTVNTAGSGVSDAEPLPTGGDDPVAGSPPSGGKSFAAKVSGESRDTALPVSASDDIPAAPPEEMEADAVAPRIARAMPGPENGGGDSAEQAPALFSALPTETPEETEAPTVQSFMVTSMLLPNEAVAPVELTAREALDRLLEESPKPGCETWEYGDIEPGWQSPEWVTADGSTAWLAYCGSSEGEEQIVCYSFDTWVLSPDGERICAATFTVPADGGEITIAGA